MPLNDHARKIFPERDQIQQRSRETVPTNTSRRSQGQDQQQPPQAIGQTFTPARAAPKDITTESRTPHPQHRANSAHPTYSTMTPRVAPQSRQPLTAVEMNARTAVPPAVAGGRPNPQDLKMDVPNTIPARQPPTLKHQTSHTTDESVSERDPRIVRPAQRWTTEQPRVRHSEGHEFGRPRRHRRNSSFDSTDEDVSQTFDEDRFDDFGDSADELQPEPTTVYRGPQLDSQLSHDHRDRMMEEVYNARQAVGSQIRADPSFEVTDQIAAAYDETLKPGVRFRAPSNDTTSELFTGDDAKDMLPSWHQNTPSKPGLIRLAAGKAQIRNQGRKQDIERASVDLRPDGRASSPLEDPNPPVSDLDKNLNVYQDFGRAKLNEYRDAARSSKSRDVQAEPANAPPAKVSASMDVSEDERTIESAASSLVQKKRPFVHTDYDDEQLRSMTWSDLEKLPFLTDPRDPPAENGIDHHGNAITPEQKLGNLSRMKADEQKSFFRSLTDDENEQVGQWFVHKFSQDLQRLMDTRLERRKLAMGYELEAQKRHKAVELRKADIDKELNELKHAGGELIKGRASPRPKPASAATSI